MIYFFFCFVLLAFCVCFLAQQCGGLPQVNTVVKIDDEYGVVVAIRPDNEYYPGELDYHHCIEVLIVDPSVQKLEQLVALSNRSKQRKVEYSRIRLVLMDVHEMP